jgi:dihydroorotate dehydrogenase subfamily 1
MNYRTDQKPEPAGPAEQRDPADAVEPVELMGLSLKNPLIVGAGPWTRDGASIRKCINAGAGAVITETVTLEANSTICPRLYYRDGEVFNTKLYSHLHLEQWEEEVEGIEKGDCRLIFSIWGSSVSELSYLARKVERLGADAIEISISAPIGTRNKNLSNHSPYIHEFVKAVVDAVEVPVMVKLSYEAAISPEFTQSIYQAGVQAVSAIDALKGLEGVDIESHTARMPTYGGYTGPRIRPISLATTATLKQCTPFQICSVGGICTCEHVLEFLMLGAQTVQIASAIQLGGYGVIETILKDLADWLHRKGFQSVAEIRGSALASLRPFEDISPTPLKAAVSRPCTIQCSLCMDGCIYDAIDRDDTGAIRIDPVICTGCGMCAARCPPGIIDMKWE